MSLSYLFLFCFSFPSVRFGLKSELSKLEDKKQDLKVRMDKIKMFIADLKNHNEVISAFDEKLWYAMVDKVAVYENGKVEFKFRNSNCFYTYSDYLKYKNK